MTQFSTFSGASETLFRDTVFPATLKTLSLLLLATGIAKTTDGGDDDDDYDDNDDDGDDDGTCKIPDNIYSLFRITYRTDIQRKESFDDR